MNQTNIKAAMAVVLFASWVAIVALKVPGADDLIGFIKAALLGLGAHTLTMVNPANTTVPAVPPSTPEQVTK